MPNLYKVTFRFRLPIRPDQTVEVVGEDEENISETAYVAAEKRGIIFGQYAYNETPIKIELIKEGV